MPHKSVFHSLFGGREFLHQISIVSSFMWSWVKYIQHMISNLLGTYESIHYYTMKLYESKSSNRWVENNFKFWLNRSYVSFPCSQPSGGINLLQQYHCKAPWSLESMKARENDALAILNYLWTVKKNTLEWISWVENLVWKQNNYNIFLPIWKKMPIDEQKLF